ncbi:MAG: RHS repeat-associated core domain-containing protein [Bacteroidia bacterium]
MMEFTLSDRRRGARWYDPAAGRWWGVDGLAEKYFSISPFAYVANNPVKFIDPDGRYIRPGNIQASSYGKVYKYIRYNSVFVSNSQAYANSKTNHYNLRYGLIRGMNPRNDYGGTSLFTREKRDYNVGSGFNPGLESTTKGNFELLQTDIHKAQVMLHESVHAGLLTQDSEFNNLSESEQHELMASEDNRTQLVAGLKEFAEEAGIEGLEDADFEALSWAGLEDTETFQALENKEEVSERIAKLTYSVMRIENDGTRTVISDLGNIKN